MGGRKRCTTGLFREEEAIRVRVDDGVGATRWGRRGGVRLVSAASKHSARVSCVLTWWLARIGVGGRGQAGGRVLYASTSNASAAVSLTSFFEAERAARRRTVHKACNNNRSPKKAGG